MTPTTESRESVEQLAEDLWVASEFDFREINASMPGQAKYETFLSIANRWCKRNGITGLPGRYPSGVCDRNEELREMAVDAMRVYLDKITGRAATQDHPTPPPTDAHRERVRKALAELRAEMSFYLPGAETTHFGWATIPTQRISQVSCAILRAEAVRLGIDRSSHWQHAHDAIARANGLPVLGEGEVLREPLTDEQATQYLAEAGIDMEPANKRLHAMIDDAKTRRETIVASESAWLIEVPHANSGSPLWYAGIGQGAVCHGKHGWTYDACKAKRFADKTQAEAYIDEHKLREQADRLIVTEHGFDTFGTAPPAPQPEVVVGERGRLVEAAQKIEQLKYDGLYAGAFVNSVHAIIANAFAHERADSAKVRAEHERDKAAILELQEMVNAAEERANVRGCELTKVRAERESLRTQLAATEAKLREAEQELKRAKAVLDPMMDAARRQFPQLFRSPQTTAEGA